MPLKVKIAANTLIQLVGKSISAGLTFVITILLARAYGPVGFGEFTQITTFVGLFYLISDFGMNAVYLREEKTRNMHFVHLLFLRAIWSMLLIFIAMAVLVFLPYNVSTNQGFTPAIKIGIIILAPSILFQSIFTSCSALFQKHLRFERSVAATIVGTFITLLLIYGLIAIHASLTVTMIAYLVGSLVLALAAILLVRPYIGQGFKMSLLLTTDYVATWKRLFMQSVPLGLTLICNLIYFRADIFILSYVRSALEVGVYGLAYKFFDVPLTIPVFFMNAVYPILLKRIDDTKAFQRSMTQSAVFLCIASLVILVIGFMAAPLITLIQPDFAPSITPFRILLVGVPFFFLSNLFMWALIALGAQKKLLMFYLTGMVVNIALNMVFIPLFGYVGAAVITGVSELGVLLLLLREYRILISRKS